MRPFPPDQCHWIIEPLLEAGLDLDRISGLFFRIGFDWLVEGGEGNPAAVAAVVSDEPARVRSAWSATILRLLAVQETGAP